MATPIVTPLPMLVDGVRIADATEGSYDIDPGVSDGVCDQGQYFKFSITRCRASISKIQPRAEVDDGLLESLLAKKSVTIQIKTGSKSQSFVGKLTGGGWKWSFENASASVDFQFVGSEPTVAGL